MLALRQCMHTARRKGLVRLSYLEIPILTDPFYHISLFQRQAELPVTSRDRERQ